MVFRRVFGRSGEDLARFAETPWGCDLLKLWRPAGQPTCDDGGLRLAIRNGTLNFYRRGQSVAKVGFGRDNRPWLEVHIAYVTGKPGLGPHYARLSSTELHCKTFDRPLPYNGPETLAYWVRQADEHKGAEKQFVDDLVTHNALVIDLEMGLSDYKSDAKSTAPRMDLVALEDAPGAPQIVFWEAKMMGNSELRCRPGTEAKPRVVGQLRKYTDWLAQGSNRADVLKAYQANCELLLRLHALARDINPAIMALDPIISRAAEDPQLTVDDRPRLIVSDPDANRSWTTNGHDAVLTEKHGIQVQLVSGESPTSFALQRGSLNLSGPAWPAPLPHPGAGRGGLR